MARSTFPDKELSVQAIKALMAARSLPPVPSELMLSRRPLSFTTPPTPIISYFWASAQGRRTVPDPESQQ